MQVTILSGVSGSGKSFFFRESMKEFGCVSADFFFYAGGAYRFDPNKLPAAHTACFRSYLHLLRAGASRIAVDNTNTTAWEISPYVMLAEVHRYSCTVLTINVKEKDLELCARRNVHGVSLEVIERQWRRLQARELPRRIDHKFLDPRF